MNRNSYDACVYQQTLNQSVSPISYIMDTDKYVNNNKCRMELGIVGGTAVSHVRGNMVDLESDLRGQSNKSSSCAKSRYVPSSVCGGEPSQIQPIPQPSQHLSPCQMVNFGPVARAPKSCGF